MSEDVALSPEAIENRRRLAAEQRLREAEQAERESLAKAKEAADILKRQEAQLQMQPRGRPAETVRTRQIPVQQLPRKPPEGQVAGTREFFARRFAKKPEPRVRTTRIVRVQAPSRRRGRKPRIFGPTGRPSFVGIRLRDQTPANISRAEKEKAISRLDAQIAEWSRKYTFRVVHGGTQQKKNEAAIRLRQLTAEKEAIESMHPLGTPEHIRRAEQWA